MKLKRESFFFFPLQRSEKEENEEIEFSGFFFFERGIDKHGKENPDS